jgi:hypothetical protein
MNTFNLLAPWYMLLAARLFGSKSVTRDGPYTLTMYYWRGKFYVTGWTQTQVGKRDDHG